MQRRSHKKSRRGCPDCKRRHIKCDENRPECNNCTIAGIKCTFTPLSLPQSRSTVQVRFVESTYQHDLSRSPSQPGTPLAHHLPVAHSVNLLHLELFSRFADSSGDLFFMGQHYETMRPHLVNYAMTSQFLMTECMSLSAVHLSVISPDRGQFLRDEAEKLRDEALRLYNDSVKVITKDNVILAYLYAGVLGIHFLAETFTASNDSIDLFLDGLVQSIRLMRGIWTILDCWGDFLRDSDMSGLLEEGRLQMLQKVTPNETDEAVVHFEELRRRIDCSNLDSSQSEVCQRAISSILKVWWSETRVNGRNEVSHPRLAITWPVMLPSDYCDLLKQRSPQALVILGYYAMSLHQCKDFWAVGDGGRRLIDIVSAYLGPEWDSWLTWPRSVIYKD